DERRRAGRARARHRSGKLDAQHEVTDVDLVSLAHDGRLRDLAPIDVRAVGALEIGDDDAPVAEQEPRMALGNIALREHEVVALHTPDVDLVLVEDLATLRSPF